MVFWRKKASNKDWKDTLSTGRGAVANTQLEAELHLRLLYLREYFGNYLEKCIKKANYPIELETFLMTTDILLDKLRKLYRSAVKADIPLSYKWFETELQRIELLIFHSKETETIYTKKDLEVVSKSLSMLFSYISFEYNRFEEEKKNALQTADILFEHMITPQTSQQPSSIVQAQENITNKLAYSLEYDNGMSMKQELSILGKEQNLLENLQQLNSMVGEDPNFLTNLQLPRYPTKNEQSERTQRNE